MAAVRLAIKVKNNLNPYSFCFWPTGGKPSGREVVERRAKLQLVLKDGFEFKEGAEVKVQSVLAYVGLDDESQKLVTRTLKVIFPGIHKRRENKQGVKQYP